MALASRQCRGVVVIGMTIVFAGMDRLAWAGGIAGVADGVFLVCAMAGGVVGACTAGCCNGSCRILLPTAMQ
jgi:hypothetical protein